jgi:exopolysaccharide biosynthesis predicted pyruvyltransferase EpsI/glycosyltransferase involved in cell wall biosynthesis
MRCLESIITQTYHNLEIILVHDSSMDNCPEICADYAKKDTRIKVIHNTCGSLSDAKNAGLNAFTGEYVYILDSDDYVEKNLIEITLANAVATSADLVLFNYMKVDEFDNLLTRVKLKAGIYETTDHNRMEYILNDLEQYKCSWEVGNRLFKADLIRRNSLVFWDDKLIKDDLGFALNFMLYAGKISCIPDTLYYYRIRKGSIRAQAPTEPKLSVANELCKLMEDKIITSFKDSKIEKEYPLLFFCLMKEQLSKLTYYNYKKSLASINDKRYFYKQLHRVITKPISAIRHYGIVRGIVILVQCILMTSKKLEKGSVFIISMINKIRKVGETYQHNKLKIKSKKHVFLIGCEDFWNLGDHHIAISELEYLQKIVPEYAIVEVTASQYFAVNRLLPLLIKRKDLICLHGGGNMGNAYMLAEYIRRDLMKKFPNNEKVIFPQTIHYDSTEAGKLELEKDQSMIKKTRNLTLCLREHCSYELAKQYFDCDLILTPDIVLFTNYVTKFNFERKGAAVILRNDVEGVISHEDKQLIEKVVQQYSKDIRVMDTQLITDINVTDRQEVVEEFISKIAKAEFVITDRLHGMVFCAITQTPCIVLPNYNHKVKGVYEWISKLDYIIMINVITELEDAIKRLIKINKIEYDNSIILEGFEVLTKLVKSKVM